MQYDLIAHLKRQKAFSEKAFGPKQRLKGFLEHIKEELVEIENSPDDLEEYIDVAMLAFDGAWRAGYTAEEIAHAFESKLTKNESRKYPDWRTCDPDKPINHIRK